MKKKRKPGRPRKYATHVKPKLKVIEQETARGATREEIARICGISVRTLAEHASIYPQLSQALRGGDQAACDIVEAALFKRATGYSHPAVKIMQSDGVVIREEYTQHYPPDTPAAVFFLCNRAADRYKQKIEHAPDESKPWPVRISFASEAKPGG